MKLFTLGLVFGVLLVGCAGATFPYHYYGVDGVDYTKGSLLGPTPKDDLSFSVCVPTDQDKHPCVIMKASDFWNLKQDYKSMQQRLNSCGG